ncbi:MAG: hypothetical protein ACR2JO_08430 [Mycobacteriales bacterium]
MTEYQPETAAELRTGVHDDVAGHALPAPDGYKGPVGDTNSHDDDVAGHAVPTPDGYKGPVVDTDSYDEDVAGHAVPTPSGYKGPVVDTDSHDDDVAGHARVSGEIRPDIYGDAGRTP